MVDTIRLATGSKYDDVPPQRSEPFPTLRQMLFVFPGRSRMACPSASTTCRIDASHRQNWSPDAVQGAVVLVEFKAVLYVSLRSDHQYDWFRVGHSPFAEVIWDWERQMGDVSFVREFPRRGLCLIKIVSVDWAVRTIAGGRSFICILWSVENPRHQ